MDLPTEELTPGTACVWWEYLQVAIGSGDGIYYQLDGAVGSRSLSVEYLLSDVSGAPYQVIAVIHEQTPGNIQYFYFSEGDGGVNATIGVQGLDANNGEFVEEVIFTGLTGTVALNALQSFRNITSGVCMEFATIHDVNSGPGAQDNCTFDLSCFPASTWPQGVCGKEFGCNCQT